MKFYLLGAFVVTTIIAVFLLSNLISCSNDDVNGSISKKERLSMLYDNIKKKNFPDINDIRAEDISFLKGNIVFVDVRTRSEMDVSMIKDAITLSEFEEDIEKYKGQEIIIYCTVGARSGMYVRRLADKGIKAYNLIWGIIGWVHSGQEVYDKGVETRRVHVHGRKYDQLPEWYEAVFK